MPDQKAAENKGPEEATAPAWMVTFADLMALLVALFVLLLSFSEIDSESFKKNAGPMHEAFNKPKSIPITETNQVMVKIQTDLPNIEELERIEEWKANFVDNLNTAMRREIAEKQIVVIEKETSVVIRFPDTTAFSSGSSELRDEVLPTLDKLATMLSRTDGLIKIAGHTDDIPITTSQFRSNWDLSTSRAVSVVHQLLSTDGIDPSRVAAQGFADSRPLEPNDTPENRSANRRVEIVVEADRSNK